MDKYEDTHIFYFKSSQLRFHILHHYGKNNDSAKHRDPDDIYPKKSVQQRSDNENSVNIKRKASNIKVSEIANDEEQFSFNQEEQQNNQQQQQGYNMAPKQFDNQSDYEKNHFTVRKLQKCDYTTTQVNQSNIFASQSIPQRPQKPQILAQQDIISQQSFQIQQQQHAQQMQNQIRQQNDSKLMLKPRLQNNQQQLQEEQEVPQFACKQANSPVISQPHEQQNYLRTEAEIFQNQTFENGNNQEAKQQQDIEPEDINTSYATPQKLQEEKLPQTAQDLKNQIERWYEIQELRDKRIFEMHDQKLHLKLEDLITLTDKKQLAPAIIDTYMTFLSQEHQNFNNDQNEIIEYIPVEIFSKITSFQRKNIQWPIDQHDIAAKTYVIQQLIKFLQNAGNKNLDPVFGFLLNFDQNQNFLIRWQINSGTAKIYCAVDSSYYNYLQKIEEQISLFKDIIQIYSKKNYQDIQTKKLEQGHQCTLKNVCLHPRGIRTQNRDILQILDQIQQHFSNQNLINSMKLSQIEVKNTFVQGRLVECQDARRP